MEKKGKNSKQGQAVIEFVLGLMILISFMFFFVKTSATFAIGNYIHYATFMAARAFASSSANPEDQEERAREVMRATVLGKFKSLIRPKDGDGVFVGAGPYYEQDPVYNYWNSGVSYRFQGKIGLYPWSSQGQNLNLELVSESWMPRSWTDSEVAAQRKRLEASIPVAGGAQVEWDNGF